MIGLDTNVLVRFLVRDDEEQHQRVAKLLRRGAAEGSVFFVGDVVLAEVVCVLRSRYRWDSLRAYEKGAGGFADHLIAERARDAGCGALVTFDKALHADGFFSAP